MFTKAERKKAKLRLALCGPSGSGKTYSALLLAQGLAPGGKIALLDTENGSGELYADIADYDTATLRAPFTPERYIAFIREAEKANYGVLIIDSLSHAWVGDGGILDMHDKATAASKGGNSFAAWREVTPQHNALVETLLSADLHIIVTMRTKTAYDMVDDGGKKRPVKIGLAPVQRDGMEYEFTVVLDLSVDGHVATATKDRTRLFDGKHFIPKVETGTSLREWLDSGQDAKAASQRLLNSLKNKVDDINDIPQLNQWWRSNTAEIELLMPFDQDEIKSYCASQKKAILKASFDSGDVNNWHDDQSALAH
ncbi:MAG: AAA family ATPase [Methylomicrobium sp.]|nr:AAA family ATPase [Methylomicrobium sp.]